jgi:3-oxoacyl-[acyl-carrier-protein] synthase-3
VTRDAYLGDIAYALGDCAESVEEAAARAVTRSAAGDFRRAGFATHHVCSAQVSAYDLARRAVAQIRDRLDAIDAIIYATALPVNAFLDAPGEFARTRDVKRLMRFPASELQAEFGLSGAAVFGLDQQACTGVLGAMRVARSLIAAEPEVARVLCVTADRFPEGALYEQAYNLVSDGAAACVVSAARAPFRILACHAVTNGALACASDDETVGSFFSYALVAMRGALSRAGLGIGEIDWIVPQNTHAAAWRILAGLLPFDFSRIHFPALAEAGHVISADNLINLKALAASGRLRIGDRLLLFMAGYGLNWQCVILERTADE